MRNCSAVEESNSQPIELKIDTLKAVALSTNPPPHYPQIYNFCGTFGSNTLSNASALLCSHGVFPGLIKILKYIILQLPCSLNVFFNSLFKKNFACLPSGAAITVK